MASPRQNRSSVRFMSFLYVCACLVGVLSQRQSVCGFGPHTLHNTGLDAFVLQGSYVMLQPIRNTQSSRIISWSSSDDGQMLLESGSTKQPNNSLKIGPMKKDFNRLHVRYTYHLGSGGVVEDVSNTAVLYMAAKDFDIVPKANFTYTQLVQVSTGANRRVFCYGLIPSAQDKDSYVPPTQRSLTRQLRGTVTTGYKTVPNERYVFRDGCLWMRSLRKTDSGKYSLRIRDCFSSQFKETVNFSLSVGQPPVLSRSTYLSKRQSLPQSQRRTEGTNPSRTIKQPTFATSTAPAPTWMRPLGFSTFMPSPKALLLTLSSGGGHIMSSCLTVYIGVNEKLNITYNVNGRRRERIEVHHNGQVAERVLVRRKKFIIIKNVNQSDLGHYQVIASDEDAEVLSIFTLIIQQQSVPTSSTTLSSTTDRLVNRTITRAPSGYAVSCTTVMRVNATESRTGTAQTDVFPSKTGTPTVGSTGERETTNNATQDKYIWTTLATTRLNGSRNSTIFSEGWVIGIIILIVSLVLLVPAVYFSCKRRHTLNRTCVRRQQDVTIGQQPHSAKYVKSAEDMVVNPAPRESSPEIEVKDSGQTDSVIGYESVGEISVHQITVEVKVDIPVRDNPAYGTI